jgi:hypothetical protein
LTGASLSPLTWYVARSSGVTLYAALWLTVMLGLGMTTTLFDRVLGRALVLSLHRYVTDLSYSLLALHMVALALDIYVPFGPADLFMPFHAMGGDVWVGLGVLTAWGTAAVGVSFSLRRWIGQRGWRLLHYGSFPLYVVALFHGLGAGTDARSRYLLVFYIATLASVFFLCSVRALDGTLLVNCRRASTTVD